MKRNGYFTFQTIISIAGAHDINSDAVGMCGFTTGIIIISKKVHKQVHRKIWKFQLDRVGTIAH